MSSVFIRFEFWSLIVTSIVAPASIYVFLMSKAQISRWAVALFGLFLVVLAGADVVLLEALFSLARLTASLLDDRIFASEFSLALYALPLLSAGIGCNLISHTLIGHLETAERAPQIDSSV